MVNPTILPIPATIEEITPEWVHKVTGHETTSNDFKLEGDIQKGIGFLSSICRVSYKTTTGDKHDIIVKLLPTDPKWLEFALSDLSDEREIQFYSIVLPDLLQVIPEIQENICLYHNGTVINADPATERNRASMLVIEDLKPKGFEMMDFAGSASDNVLNNLMVFLARLHFGALAIEVNKGTPLPKLYPFMQGITDNAVWKNQVEGMINDGYALLDKLLSSNGVSRDIFNHFKKLEPFTQDIVQRIEDFGRQIPCLIHGDIWPPNIQVHDSLPAKILDWQLLGYRDVTYDLSILLYTVLPKEKLTKDNLRQLVKRYHDEFEQLCNESGYGDKIKRRTWEDLEEVFFTWGSAFAYMVFMTSIECYSKDYPKFANIFKVLSDEISISEFLCSVRM